MSRAAKPGVLLIDAGERSAVAASESLVRAGYRVGTASSQSPAPASWSRFSERRFRLPNPRASAARFAAQVAKIAAVGTYLTVLPCSEGSLWAMSSNRNAFSAGAVTVGLPERRTVERCTDKSRLIETAKEVGLSAPATVVCESPAEALTAAEGFGFPAVLKPVRTVFEAEEEEARHLASTLVDDRESLEAGLAEAGIPCLIQRREAGPVVSVGGVFADGRLLATACSRYLRTWPAEAGSVAFSESIEAPDGLRDSVASLVGRLGWQGIFELELIERGPGDYAVLDFNPRIYGSMALAVKAGAPLPAVWCDWLLKGKEADLTARPGVHYRWEDADLRNAIRCLGEGHPARAASILVPTREVAHAYFRWYDPVPLAVRGLRPFRKLSNRVVAVASRRR